MFGLKKVVGSTAARRFSWNTRSMFSGSQRCIGRIISLRRPHDRTREDYKVTGVRRYACGDPCARTKLMNVNCKTALITGGATGIGFAIADALLGAGLQKVYMGSRNHKNGAIAVSRLEKKHGEGRSEYLPLDVNNQKQFEDAFKTVICKDGSVDILVNNAGILNDRKWELEIDTNVKGVMRGILLANRYMPKQKHRGGCVVNVASTYGFDAFPYAPGFNSTKHAVVGLTKSFGDPAHFRKSGVRHIALGPGVTITSLIEHSASNLLTDEWGKLAFDGLKNLPLQSSEAVGRGTVYMIEYGPPGSLWVVEGYQLQRLKPPDRKTYQTKVVDL